MALFPHSENEQSFFRAQQHKLENGKTGLENK
jgi:hypothetical protein